MLPSINTIWAKSDVIVLASAKEIDTFACFIAMVSLIPSPTNALPLFLQIFHYTSLLRW